MTSQGCSLLICQSVNGDKQPIETLIFLSYRRNYFLALLYIGLYISTEQSRDQFSRPHHPQCIYIHPYHLNIYRNRIAHQSPAEFIAITE